MNKNVGRRLETWIYTLAESRSWSLSTMGCSFETWHGPPADLGSPAHDRRFPSNSLLSPFIPPLQDFMRLQRHSICARVNCDGRSFLYSGSRNRGLTCCQMTSERHLQVQRLSFYCTRHRIRYHDCMGALKVAEVRNHYSINVANACLTFFFTGYISKSSLRIF